MFTSLTLSSPYRSGNTFMFILYSNTKEINSNHQTMIKDREKRTSHFNFQKITKTSDSGRRMRNAVSPCDEKINNNKLNKFTFTIRRFSPINSDQRQQSSLLSFEIRSVSSIVTSLRQTTSQIIFHECDRLKNN